MHPSEVDFQRAATDAFREQLRELKTEFLPACRLAKLFGVGKNKIAEILDCIDGVETVGEKHRVPVASMPLSYFYQLTRGEK